MTKLLIQFSHVFKNFNSLPLFEGISLSIDNQGVSALIGENGSGKTTLLKLMTGAILPDAGQIVRAPHLTVGFLPQEISFASNQTVKDYLEEGSLSEVEGQMEACLEADRLAEWTVLHEQYEQQGGYRKVPLEKVFHGLKLKTELLTLPMAQLSSGQKVRIALAKTLIANPDLLLLDEPTNHLDEEVLKWLQKMLVERQGATLIVSHDRKWINGTCNKLIEVKNGQLNSYSGNYDFYLREQQRLEEKQRKAYEAQQEEKKRLKQSVKAITFSKAHATPPSDRNLMAYDRRGENHQKSLQRRLDAMKGQLAEIEANPLLHPKPKSVTGLRFHAEPLSSLVAIELEQVTKRFQQKTLFSHFTQTLQRGERVILRGANGAGKTTLLKSILGLVPLDSGWIRVAPSVKIGYLDQELEALPLEETPLVYFGRRFQLDEEKLRSELHKAAIGGIELLRRPFSTLSVGQRKRFFLLSLILEKPNVLILDEPTNHLDLATLEALEAALLDFEGAILAVSHDATFVDKIATREWTL